MKHGIARQNNQTHCVACSMRKCFRCILERLSSICLWIDFCTSACRPRVGERVRAWVRARARARARRRAGQDGGGPLLGSLPHRERWAT